MELKKAQKEYEKGWAIDVLIEDSIDGSTLWVRCQYMQPKDWIEGIIFRYGQDYLEILSRRFLKPKFNKCKPRKYDSKKSMSVTKFLKKKNKILRKYIGIDFDLVPKDQIEECEREPLSIRCGYVSCPYCMVYGDHDKCLGCPMKEADNKCFDSDSTWGRYIIYCKENNIRFHYIKDSPAYKPMKKLIDKYNNQFKDNE